MMPASYTGHTSPSAWHQDRETQSSWGLQGSQIYFGMDRVEQFSDLSDHLMRTLWKSPGEEVLQLAEECH